MLPAAEALKPTIVHLPLRAPQGFRIVSSNKGAPILDDVDAIRADLSGATARRVEWLDSIERLVEEGVQRFICLGPGRACAHLLSKELAYRDRLRVAQGMQPAEYEVWSITSVEDVSLQSRPERMRKRLLIPSILCLDRAARRRPQPPLRL
jgi:hypothetical protein